MPSTIETRNYLVQKIGRVGQREYFFQQNLKINLKCFLKID